MVFMLALGIVFIISVLGVTGGMMLIYREKWANFVSKYLITFAVGAMLGVVFLDLLPEAISTNIVVGNILVYSVIGVVFFYLLEKTLLWYHHHSVYHIWHSKHTPEEKAHPAGYLITFGDALHNFTDGLIIAAGFLTNMQLGISTSLAVLFHELPEEIGVFAVLLHAKFGRLKTIIYSLGAQMTAVIGFLLGFYYLPLFEGLKAIVLAFAAGGFIYIASTDLLPETHNEKDLGKSLAQIILLILGIFTIYLTSQILHE
ncbi:MAG: ZIP family metal transporter [Candidatus Aenigmarchaeota archaeon]|nr:ZIP family metal transporter [Candidatus Aenigmarchaeota archaeon]